MMDEIKIMMKIVLGLMKMMMMVVVLRPLLRMWMFITLSMLLDMYCCFYDDDPNSYYILGHIDLYYGLMSTYKL